MEEQKKNEIKNYDVVISNSLKEKEADLLETLKCQICCEVTEEERICRNCGNGFCSTCCDKQLTVSAKCPTGRASWRFQPPVPSRSFNKFLEFVSAKNKSPENDLCVKHNQVAKHFCTKCEAIGGDKCIYEGIHIGNNLVELLPRLEQYNAEFSSFINKIKTHKELLDMELSISKIVHRESGLNGVELWEKVKKITSAFCDKQIEQL